MRVLALAILFPLLLSVNGLGRHDAAAKAAPKPASKKAPDKAGDKGAPAEVRLADESTVKVGVLQENLSIVTRYGKLTVPAREVRRIAFGRRYPEGVAKRIDAAIARLGGRDFKDREVASAELLARGELAYPALVRALKSKDLEIAKRAKALVDLLQAKFSEERLRTPAHDVIDTDAFTIIGHIEGPTIKVSTAYFGDVPLRLIDLRSLRSTSDRGTTKVVVDAAKYAGSVQTWMETKIEVSAETELKITATGRVDLYPLAGSVGMYMATPAGSAGAGAVRVGMVVPQATPGALVGRVGRSGKAFLIGEDYKGKPGQEGRLYLSIMPSAWNNASSGEYTVTIRPSVGR